MTSSVIFQHLLQLRGRPWVCSRHLHRQCRRHYRLTREQVAASARLELAILSC